MNLVGIREEGVLTPNQAQKVEVQYVLNGGKFIALLQIAWSRGPICVINATLLETSTAPGKP